MTNYKGKLRIKLKTPEPDHNNAKDGKRETTHKQKTISIISTPNVQPQTAI